MKNWRILGLGLGRFWVFLLLLYIWIVGVSKFVIVWRCVGDFGIRVNLCVGGGEYLLGFRE